jgi:hypothetical protein
MPRSYLRGACLTAATTLLFSSGAALLMGGIASGDLPIPWHVPGAAAINLAPLLHLALLWAVSQERMAAAINYALPRRSGAASTTAVSSRRPEMTENVLIGLAATLWHVNAVGPALVAITGSYLSVPTRVVFAAQAAMLLLWCQAAWARSTMGGPASTPLTAANAVALARGAAFTAVAILFLYWMCGGLVTSFWLYGYGALRAASQR